MKTDYYFLWVGYDWMYSYWHLPMIWKYELKWYHCTTLFLKMEKKVLMAPWTSCQIRKSRVAHAPGMPGTFSPPPRTSDPDMHQGTCVTHVPWCMPGSLIIDFLWSRWRGKHSQRSRHMRNPQFYVSGKRPIVWSKWVQVWLWRY